MRDLRMNIGPNVYLNFKFFSQFAFGLKFVSSPQSA